MERMDTFVREVDRQADFWRKHRQTVAQMESAGERDPKAFA
jgi:hypothetical protein